MSEKATAGNASSLEDAFASCFPTPVRRLAALPPGSAALWLKDDGQSGTLYGGNKVRKLGPLLAHAVERGKERVVTFGAAGSHHVLATTLFAEKLGLRTLAVLTPQIETQHARDTFRCSLGAGAEVVAASSVGRALRIPRRLTRRDYVIAPGGMGALGASGYFDAATELDSQIRAGHLPRPDWIVLATGSGSTAAGLLAGLRQARLPSRLLAVLAAPNPAIRPIVLAQAAAVARMKGAKLPYAEASASIDFDRSQVGSGYGYPTAGAERAIELAARAELTLDHTYTGKAFAAAMELAARLGRSSNVLFWNTLSAAPLAPLLASAPEVSDLPSDLRLLLRRSPG